MTEREFLEAMAAAAHDAWADWHHYVRSRGGYRDGDPCHFRLPAEWVTRWDRQAALPYAALRDDERQSDRDVVERYYLPIILRYFSERTQLEDEAAAYGIRPLNETCTYGGSPQGDIMAWRYVECDLCGGGGVRYDSAGRGTRCPTCDGIGKLNAAVPA